MKIAALQMDIVWENRAANYRKAEQGAARAVENGADLIVLPEMFATGFSMNTAVTAEPQNGETVTFLKNLARTLKVGIIGGFVKALSDGRAQNCAVAVDREGVEIAVYAKSYLFSYMGEDKYHVAGDGVRVFEFDGLRCACFICYDLRFPELFRQVCRETDAAFVIASWPADRAPHWKTLLPARAVENQFYVVGVNRVGNGHGLRFQGDSMIVDPAGELLEAGNDVETILIADITSKRVREVRSAMPFLNDYRGS